MAADFVARLGSRGTVPGEVRTSWGIQEYVGALARPVADEELRRIARRARAVRRTDAGRVVALLGALADPPLGELNRARLGAIAGIPPTTLQPYVDVLVEIGVVRLLPGCRAAPAKRAIGRPQVVFDDPALARHLAGHTPDQLVQFAGRWRLAPLLRTLVAAELLRQQATSVVEHRVSYLRERNGLEVGLVVELPDESLYGIEVLTAAGLRPHQFARLEALARRAGGRFRGGVVLNTASVGHRYGPRLWGLPIRSVWDG
ncbi:MULTISPECIES: DUF4143 domain-containing protein [unclassified Nocardioides]|uniref:DUF4143 domain-containing protein n=1 Tax=unclassified Nocardioides TaxID=2615069 RepID=UPI0007033612|nr:MULTISPECIES: DUF4143 domain-containing protein [unclassified Nocardioides]KRC53857.1 hypothetical protein ASE19_07155 [Nocardioides sp. Root79]KRC71193.1 hypothetical protein ASE20_09570 [Nocardioides sp. Root240]